MNDYIDRTNKEDLLKQIGRVEEKTKNINREISKIDREINRMPRRKIHLEKVKIAKKQRISNNQLYLNQLEENLKSITESQ